jgi:hypothetical protein
MFGNEIVGNSTSEKVIGQRNNFRNSVMEKFDFLVRWDLARPQRHILTKKMKSWGKLSSFMMFKRIIENS